MHNCEEIRRFSPARRETAGAAEAQRRKIDQPGPRTLSLLSTARVAISRAQKLKPTPYQILASQGVWRAPIAGGSGPVAPLSESSPLLRYGGFLAQGACHSDYAVHRRADFVASARESEYGVEESPAARLRVNDREQSPSLVIRAERSAGDDRSFTRVRMFSPPYAR